jgi:hypothetical protein
MKRGESAEHAAGQSAGGDKQSDLQVNAPLKQIGKGAARAIRDNEHQRRARRVRRREA